ncbi:MAG: amidohydrolase family protein [Acidobacteria bacterium]|nr:amidohydrolase family protein [Acidobacteriota bacterium]
MIFSRAVSFVNARVVAEAGIAESVRFGARVLAIGDRPRRGDTVVDLEGAVVLPGLVNAHDHLELNHYGRLKFRDRYQNASEWNQDMEPRLSRDKAIAAARTHPLTERLFIGALKNLLAGVTMVAHHNPFYPELRRTIPIRVLRRYGWAHSFYLERRPAGAYGEHGGDVAGRWRATPPDLPFFVHLAEGVDVEARSELPRLEALGCVASNTAIVHGVAIDGDEWPRVARHGAGLVWCPASNVFLFGQTAAVRQALDGDGASRPTIALATDSRLTGSRDLLDELRAARAAARVTPDELLRMVTCDAAALLRQPRAGRTTVGAPADLVVIPPVGETPAAALVGARRKDVGLVTVEGRPLVGDPSFAAVFGARRVTARRVTVDAVAKLMDSALVRRIAGCPIAEPGVALA